MKKTYLVALFLTFLAIGTNTLWGADVTYTFKDASDCPGNAQTWTGASIDANTTWSATKGGSNDPKYYTTGTGLRVYNGGTFTITSSKIISEIVLTFSSSSYTFSTSMSTPATVLPKATSYQWSVSRTCRLQKIEITYGSSKTNVSLTPSVSPSGAGSITFTPKGGTTTTDQQITVEESTEVSAEATATSANYAFKKWNITGATPTTSTDNPVTIVVGNNSTATIEAVFEQAITVTYDANGGTVNPASDSYTNTALTLPTPTIDGCYTFDGWYTAQTGGTKVTSPYTPTANITLYAHWTESTDTYMAMITQPDAATNCKVKISKDGTTGVEDGYDDITCGTIVYLLGTPSNGYKGLTYTAKDDNKNDVTITPNGLQDASFTMPASNVDITATPVACDAMDAPVVTYTSSTGNSLTFSWNAIAGATGYNLYLYYNTDGTSHAANDDMANTTECSYTFSDLEVGHTYAYTIQARSAIATCFTETHGTATVVKPYTITWSTPDGTTTTTVVPGNKVVLPTATPTSCSTTYTTFVGWFTETASGEGNPSTAKPATQVTAETVPTRDATYYAVFSDATGGGALEKVTSISNGDVIYLATSPTGEGVTGANGSKDATISSSVSEWMPFTVNVVTGGFTLTNNGNGVTGAKGSFKLSTDPTTLTFNDKGYFTFVVGTTTYCLLKNGNGGSYYRCYAATQIGASNYTQFFMYKGGSSATGYISLCCNDPAVITVTPAATTINLGEDGTATTTVSCTQQGGGTGTWAYAVAPATATFDGTTFTATAAGTYTLTATFTENCPKSGTATITVTKDPVFGTVTIDQNTFAVDCGDTTSTASAATITLGTNYNLTKAVTVTAPEGFLVSTNKTDKTKYAASVTLTPTASGSNQGKITGKVYVRAYSAIARTEGYSGNITLSGNEITTQTIAVSSTVTCKEYTITIDDRGSKSTLGNYYAGAEVPQPADPTGVCTEPVEYIFDGWAAADVAEGSTTYTKVSFPYTMPKGNTTLYAVYKYAPTISNDYKKITTSAALTDGEYLIVGYSSSTYKALSSSEGSTDGQYKAVAVTQASDVITTDDETLIWDIAVTNNQYTIAQGGQYLNINNSVMVLESTAIPYTLSVSSGVFTFTTTDSKSSSTTKISYYANNGIFNAYRNANTVYLYRRQQDIRYTTSPACGPRIKGTGDIAVTSAKGIWVEAVTPLAVSAQNLDKNDDNAAVSIAATSLTDGFTLKTSGTNGSGSKTVTLATGYSNSTYNANMVVVYTPTADNTTEEGKIALRVYKANGSTTYATDTITVRGRSLPMEFVVAAKTTDGWVALPSDLGTGSSSSLKAPYSVSVDDETNPTKATEAPETAVYNAADRSTKNTAATGIRLKNAGGLYLQGSTAQGNTNVWLSANNSEQAQSWELRSSDFVNYFVRLQASESGRYLSYDAAQGKIGNYKQQGASLRLLPVEKTCVRYDAPSMDVFALKSSAVTLRWLAIEGATGYEYSTDGETTWSDCNNLTATASEVKWTLDGLTANNKYTVYVRVKVASGETNCSASDSETFTTPDCDDVPTELKATADANSATITWQCNAATATVKIYSDAQGDTEVASKTNTASPCTITDLVAGTKYYYQVFAGGSCGSAIAHFTTESADVSIVEWGKGYVTVDINTDVDGVSLVVENQVKHSTGTGNVADDLFFSKYYEASGNLKLVGVYNGTKDTLPLTDVKIQIGVSTWGNIVSMSAYGKYKTGYIAPDEEIIVWHRGTANVNTCVEGKMDISIMVEHNNISFSGRASVGLFRAGELIDIIGAGTTTTPMEGTCTPAWGDDPGWCGTGYNIEDPTMEIELATNRCLLVRSNKVKSGANAIAQNTTDFVTLTKEEWLGRQVSKTDAEQSSCEGFAYVADFDYDGYYATYDSITSLKDLGADGKRNPDGTFTIPVSRLDTMACTNFRILLKKDGAVVAQEEQKVSIIVDKNTNTADADYFLPRLTVKACKECDIIVREGVLLEHTSDSLLQFNNMDIYTGSRLKLGNRSMTLDEVRMHATNDNVSYAILNNSSETGATISINQVVHIKRIDGRYWYPFSLPYDCKIGDIRQTNGQSLGTFGVDWGIKFYDGQRRQQDGNSTTAAGEVSMYWTMMDANATLEAHKGYIIGLFGPDESMMQSVCFTPTTESNYTESDESKTTSVQNWYTDNLLTTEARHHGWNFVGSPYISLFGSATDGEGLYNTSLQMGYTDNCGIQQDADHVYVSIPDPGDANTYTQALAGTTTLKPFMAYFVQTIDPTDGASHTIDLTYSKTNRSLPVSAPRRAQDNTKKTLLIELNLTGGSMYDNAGVLVSDRYSARYEIGSDLTKMYAAASKPQLFTTDAAQGKMAYQSLPDALAHNVPLGMYVPAAGDYTLSLNRSASEVAAAEAVYLLHNGNIVANLLYSDYDLTATKRGLLSGYSLDIRRAPDITTDTGQADAGAPHITCHDGMLTIDGLPTEASVQVYDMLGRVLADGIAAGSTLSVPVATTGVYTICVTAEDYHFVTKTIIR